MFCESRRPLRKHVQTERTAGPARLGRPWDFYVLIERRAHPTIGGLGTAGKGNVKAET